MMYFHHMQPVDAGEGGMNLSQSFGNQNTPCVISMGFSAWCEQLTSSVRTPRVQLSKLHVNQNVE